MENAIEFDLNVALRLWRERLSESPQFRAENLDELESHLRDSMAALQTKGLSAEESFLIGARRVGSAAALEREFAGENGGRGWRNFLQQFSYKYLDKVVHGLVLLYFTTGCWLLWGVMTISRMMGRLITAIHEGRPFPQFTVMFLWLADFWYVPPLLALIYCGFAWTRKTRGRSTWFGFFALTTALLLLLALPVLIAAGLPVIDFLNIMPDYILKHTPQNGIK
jgi:hypothetical protein